MNDPDETANIINAAADAAVTYAPNLSLFSSNFSMLTVENETTMSSINQQEEICRFRGTTENFIIVITFFVIFLLSVIGNLLVLLVIIKQRAMRSITNIYLLNLAASDMMLSVVCMPPTLVSMVMNCWMFGNYMCKILAYLQPVVVTASAYTLAVIAFERYYAICRPLHSRIWQTRSHAYAMITLVWGIAIVANVLMLFMYEQQTYNLNGYTCAPIHPPIYHFAYQVYMTVVLLVIPLFIMTVLYGHVIGSLKTGIKLEIAAVSEAPAMMTTNPNSGLLKTSHSSNNIRSLLDSSSSLARATSCIALYPLTNNNNLADPTSTSPPPPPVYLELPPMNGKYHVKPRRRSSCVILPKETAIPSIQEGERKLTFWQILAKKLTFSQQEKNGVENDMGGHRRSEASICIENPSLRSTHTQKSAMAKQRVIKMLIVVVIIFFCCWTPSYIWWLLLIAGDSFQTLNLSVWNSDINTFITLLTYISSCTNPITYCFLNKKFRNGVYATFGRKKNIRHHFQKVYIPVNGSGGGGGEKVGGAAIGGSMMPTTTPTISSKEKPTMNRSVSSMQIRQHQVVFNGAKMIVKEKTKKMMAKTVHSSLIHHNRVREDEIAPIF